MPNEPTIADRVAALIRRTVGTDAVGPPIDGANAKPATRPWTADGVQT